MPADCYKIEVIHFLNPHLVWVEVHDSMLKEEFSFEQVGVYGVLPQEITVVIETNGIGNQKCEDWMPAATAVMKSQLDKSVEVWFSPTHIDKKTSIFDDNIHKYGEILIKTEKGIVKKLSNLLIKSGFAYCSVSDFHEKLSCGKLKTKLNTLQTQEVIRQFEYFYKKNKSKNNWKRSVEKQTSVFHISQNLESSLTVSNVEKHNNQIINKTLQNKFKDFELCKDVDEPSLGRAFKKSKSELIKDSDVLKTKVCMDNVNSPNECEIGTTFDIIRKFLDSHSKVKERDLKINNESDSNEEAKSQVSSDKINCKENSRMIKNFNKFKVVSKDVNLKTNNDMFSINSVIQKNIVVEKSVADVTDHEHPIANDSNSRCINGLQEGNMDTSISSDKRILYKPDKRLIAYGPPGLDPKYLKIQVRTSEDFDTEPKTDIQHKVTLEERVNVFRDADNLLKISSIENTEGKNLKKVYKTESQSNDSIEKKSLCSLSLQTRLEAHKNFSMKHGSSLSSSESAKGFSNDTTSSKVSDDEEDIENVIQRINSVYKEEQKKDEDKPQYNDVITKLKNNVNPFRNIDPNISVFVDKLCTPILMVHSKYDRRIQPVFEMRDVYFTIHIHNVLRNMSVERPMMLQALSWRTILRGYSLFMISPMGSGKTLGYLPAVCRLANDTNANSTVESVGPICIIVCATAQSATNVKRMARAFMETRQKVLACFAGVDNSHITARLMNGCDLLICTPSSLVRLLQLNNIGVDLRRLSTFVLDDCERLSEVYGDEIKFCLYKIKEMLKTRANKELRIQYVLASRVWCNFMEPLAKKVPDTVICIGAFQECVLYSKANMSVSFVKRENKMDSIFEFIKDINMSKRTVVVCQSDHEVRLLEKAFKQFKYVVFACDNNMTIHDLYNLSVSWADYEEPLIGPILICCDSNLIHMNITNAHNLIHFSLPPLFSMFCKRFSVLNDNYPSIFNTDNENVKIKVLLEESNVGQLPKILNFIRRCTENVPNGLDKICSEVLAEKDRVKAQSLYPICDSLLSLGYCPDFYNCQERHSIIKEYDTPKEWLPKEGVITCKIIHYHSATLYSARILACNVNDTTFNYPQTFAKLSLEMGMYYSKESNRKLHGIPQVGDSCAMAKKSNFFVRCQVLKILSKYERGNPNNVLVRVIDEERLEVTRDIYLYYLPEHFKVIESRICHIRLANIVPKEKDITFSDLARDSLKKITDSDKELIVKGNVVLTLGNCIYVNTLEACKHLSSQNEVVVKYNLKAELLENHALTNLEHLQKILKLCTDSGLIVKQNEHHEPTIPVPVKNLPKGIWAHFDGDSIFSVFLASTINPDKFFVRHDKFESCMRNLLQDVNKYVDTKPTGCVNLKEGDIALAKFPDDLTYERARIDNIRGDKANCFFIDQGDWREVPLEHLLPITEQLINQLPFQAIECRLIGIQPLGEQWTDFSTNWFTDNCYNADGDLKHLFLKYVTKEPAECTDGFKYGIILIDTSTEHDVILNRLMIDLNLARENEESKYLSEYEITLKQNQKMQFQENGLDDWEAISATSLEFDKIEEENGKEKEPTSPMNSLFQQPVRSVAVVNSDNESDDSDRWDVNIDDSCLEFFPGLKVLNNLKQNISTVTPTSKLEDYKKSEGIKRAEIIELDSDDLTSPDSTFIQSNATPEKPAIEFTQTRYPKLVWRQNKNSVIVKIQLIGVDRYSLDIGIQLLKFKTNIHETEYGFELQLYGVVNERKSTHVNKGQYILVKLHKMLMINWLNLYSDRDKKNWIVYDVDCLDTSSDEEPVDDSSIKHIVKDIHDNVESDSDDDFLDDIDNTHKNIV